jgi:hypothetical protein
MPSSITLYYNGKLYTFNNTPLNPDSPHSVKGEVLISIENDIFQFMLVEYENALLEWSHPGGFGEDYLPVKIDEKTQTIIDDKDHATHYIVWKIPSDISDVIQLPKNILYPVGTYPLMLDRRTPDDYDKPRVIISKEATKLRMIPESTDGNAPPHFHTITYVDEFGKLIVLAALSSAIILKRGLNGDPEALARLAFALNKVCKIDAMSCHGMHHAIIFNYSPQKFAEILDTDPEIIRTILKHADSDDQKEKIKNWNVGFITQFK